MLGGGADVGDTYIHILNKILFKSFWFKSLHYRNYINFLKGVYYIKFLIYLLYKRNFEINLNNLEIP